MFKKLKKFYKEYMTVDLDADIKESNKYEGILITYMFNQMASHVDMSPVLNEKHGLNFSPIYVKSTDLCRLDIDTVITNGKYSLVYKGVAFEEVIYGGGLKYGALGKGDVYKLIWINNDESMYIPEEELGNDEWRIDN